jgi:UDP-N-acetylmuramyl pentapeptide phosphotransferase/UDP-N-acetylglucosamine-1-phosphate transferase
MTSLFIYALILSLFSGILVIILTSKYKLFIDHGDTDKPQSFHSDATPRAGGLGILTGSMLLLFSSFGLKFIIPILFAFASGIFEDFHNSLSPKLRLFLQFIAAVTAVWLTDSVVTYLGLGITMPYWMGAIFSIFAIVGMMNAINIIDGFNGLASGVILFILGSFALVANQHHNIEILSTIVIIAGALLGFMILNFPKGKIFLGDGGAYMLGFIVAILGIFLASQYENISPWYIIAIFIYPVWEVLFSIARKISIGLSPMQPDSYHMHMLIYRHITKNNPLTALFIWITLLPSTILATLYSHSSMINIIISFSFVLIYIFFYKYLYTKEKSL